MLRVYVSSQARAGDKMDEKKAKHGERKVESDYQEKTDYCADNEQIYVFYINGFLLVIFKKICLIIGCNQSLRYIAPFEMFIINCY